MSSSPPTQIIEHIVLFKVKDNTDSTKIISMINGLNSLITIPQVLHLSAAPIHRLKSTSAFTHILHSRYKSKEDLNAYTNHPDHLLVVNESLPIFEDILAVDWIADQDQVTGNLAPPPGSIGKITLLKVKENLSDEEKTEIMEVMKEKVPGIDYVTVGKNFSPIRAKGFSIGSIAFCNDLGEMDTNMDKIRDLLDDTIVVEFVVSSSSQSKLE